MVVLDDLLSDSNDQSFEELTDKVCCDMSQNETYFNCTIGDIHKSATYQYRKHWYFVGQVIKQFI